MRMQPNGLGMYILRTTNICIYNIYITCETQILIGCWRFIVWCSFVFSRPVYCLRPNCAAPCLSYSDPGLDWVGKRSNSKHKYFMKTNECHHNPRTHPNPRKFRNKGLNYDFGPFLANPGYFFFLGWVGLGSRSSSVSYYMIFRCFQPNII